MKLHHVLWLILAGATFLASVFPIHTSMPNFSPVYALMLMGGLWSGHAGLNHQGFWLAPIFGFSLAQFFHESAGTVQLLTMLGSLSLFTLIGSVVKPKLLYGLLASLAGGTVFFLTTNFIVWLGSSPTSPYCPTLQQCYAVALPFFRNTLASGLLYTTVFMGLWLVAVRRIPALRTI